MMTQEHWERHRRKVILFKLWKIEKAARHHCDYCFDCAALEDALAELSSWIAANPGKED